jgi:hypothetical protein
MFTSGDYLGLDFSGVTVGAWKPLNLYSRNYINVTSGNIDVSSKSQTKNIVIDSSGDWSFSTNADWIQLSSDGKSLNIQINENRVKENREAIITLSLKSKPNITKQVKISQLKTVVDTQLLAAFANASYNEPLYVNAEPNATVIVGEYTGWKLKYAHKEGVDDPYKSDFWYQIYEHEESNSVVISFRGTAPIEPNIKIADNWLETFMLIANGPLQKSNHPQDINVKNEIIKGKNTEDKNSAIRECLESNKSIYITGHSLGGHLAVMAYILMQDEGFENNVVRVETFNAVGIAKNDYKQFNGNGEKVIQNYTCCDIATWASNAFSLKYVGTRNMFDIRDSNNEVHRHSNERSVTGFLLSPVISSLVEPTQELSIGIGSHKLEKFFKKEEELLKVTLRM